MKRLRLLFQFYHKSIFALLLVIVIMTVSCFSLLYTVGTAHYVTYTRKLFQGVIPENSYCIVLNSFTAYGGDNFAAYTEGQQNLLRDLKENPLISTLSYMQYTDSLKYSEEEQFVILLYNSTLWNQFTFAAEQTADSCSCISATPF